MVTVVGVDAKLVDDLKGVLAPVGDVDQRVIERGAVVAGKAVPVAERMSGGEDVVGDDLTEQALEFAIRQVDVIKRFELLTEVLFECSSVANVRSVLVLQATKFLDEMVFKFTHSITMDWMLPGVAPTGRKVEVALVAIVQFRDGKLAYEHIYWDQASVLVQIGLLNPDGLPVVGAAAARKALTPTLPSNTLMAR